MENYKKWITKIIFALKNCGFQGYFDKIIIKLVFIATKGKKSTVTLSTKTKHKI